MTRTSVSASSHANAILRAQERAFWRVVGPQERALTEALAGFMDRSLEAGAVEWGEQVVMTSTAIRRLALVVEGIASAMQGFLPVVEIREDGIEAQRAARTRWARDNGARLVRNVSDETRARIRAIAEEAAQTGQSLAEVTKRVQAEGFAIKRASRIARTETHNAATWAQLEEGKAARTRGLDLVKVWRASYDGRTRPAHAAANRQMRELDEPFSVGGRSMMRPGDPAGGAAQVVNCRCVCSIVSRRGAMRVSSPGPLNRPEPTTTGRAAPNVSVTPRLMQRMGSQTPTPAADAGIADVIPDPEDLMVEASRLVLARGRATGNEHIVAWDFRTGRTYVRDGKPGSVELPDEMKRGELGRSVIVVHNHPGITGIPLSPPDYQVAAFTYRNAQQVERMVAVAHDGSVYVARPITLDGFDAVKRATNAYWRAKLLAQRVGLTDDEGYALTQHAFGLALSKTGHFDYDYSLSPRVRLLFREHADLVAKMVELFVAEIGRQIRGEPPFTDELPPILFEPHAWTKGEAREAIERLRAAPVLSDADAALLAYLRFYFE